MPEDKILQFFKYTFLGKIQFLPFPAAVRTAATAETLSSELQGAPTTAGTPGPLETPEGMLARAGTPATATTAGTQEKPTAAISETVASTVNFMGRQQQQ
jgi:hypothetical protein